MDLIKCYIIKKLLLLYKIKRKNLGQNKNNILKTDSRVG